MFHQTPSDTIAGEQRRQARRVAMGGEGDLSLSTDTYDYQDFGEKARNLGGSTEVSNNVLHAQRSTLFCTQNASVVPSSAL